MNGNCEINPWTPSTLILILPNTTYKWFHFLLFSIANPSYYPFYGGAVYISLHNQDFEDFDDDNSSYIYKTLLTATN